MKIAKASGTNLGHGSCNTKHPVYFPGVLSYFFLPWVKLAQLVSRLDLQAMDRRIELYYRRDLFLGL